MDVDLITKDTENLLVSSLRAAISDVNGGASPNDALSKQARDNGLGPELSCRLVEAFNTSKTLNRLRNTKGDKRAESFDLADRDTVVASLYDNADQHEKSAGLVRYNDPHNVNFNTKPKGHHEKAAADGKNFLGRMGGTAEGPGGECTCPKCGTTKAHTTGKPCTDEICPSCGVAMTRSSEKSAALSVGTEYTKKALYGLDGHAVVAGRSFLNSIKNARDEYRMHIKKAKEDVSKRLGEFVEAFKRADRNAMSPLKDVEERLSYHFGSVAKQAMDIAWSQLPWQIRNREKRAESVPESYVYPLDDELYKLGEALISSINEAADLHAEFTKFDKKAQVVETHFKTQVDALACRAPAGVKNVESVLTEDQQLSPILSKSAAGYEPHKKEEGKGGSPFDMGLDKLLDIPDSKPVAPKSMFPAEHEGRLRGIKTKLMLNDMIANDPVISGYPVEDITNAYNRLAELAPALSTQPIAMRGLIANMLQREGGLEAMEVKNVLDTEESKRKLRVLGD